jgi:hypothetical protein
LIRLHSRRFRAARRRIVGQVVPNDDRDDRERSAGKELEGSGRDEEQRRSSNPGNRSRDRVRVFVAIGLLEDDLLVAVLTGLVLEGSGQAMSRQDRFAVLIQPVESEGDQCALRLLDRGRIGL